MKIILSLIAVFLFFTVSSAQSKKISKDEYEKVFQVAVSKTNADYPVIFKVTTSFIENGKTVDSETEVVENEAEGRSRQKRTVLNDGKETITYQINAGFGSVYCSNDGVKWEGPSQYECRRSMTIYGPRTAESIEYSVTEKTVNGKKVKIYREYSVFPPSKGSKVKKFSEKVSTVDARGFFITVEGIEGTLDPKTTTLKREQSWITKAKIEPVVAPIKKVNK